MAHQKSEMGIIFDGKRGYSMEAIYKSFKIALEAEFGPQLKKGVCRTSRELKKPNTPVYLWIVCYH